MTRAVFPDDPGEWRSVPQLPAALNTFEAASFLSRCVSMTIVAEQTLPEEVFVSAMTSAPSGALVFAGPLRPAPVGGLRSQPPMILRVRPDGFEEVSVPGFTEDFRGLGVTAAATSRGKVWLVSSAVSSTTTLYVGDLDNGFERVGAPPREPGIWVRWLAITEVDGEETVYLLNDRGTLHRYRTQQKTWHTLRRQSSKTNHCHAAHPVGWCGKLVVQGDLVIGSMPRGRSEVLVHEIQSDMARVLPIPEGYGGRTTSVGVTSEGAFAIVPTLDGTQLFSVEATRLSFVDRVAGRPFFTLDSFRNRYILAGTGGDAFIRSDESCPALENVAPFDVGASVVLGEDTVLMARGPTTVSTPQADNPLLHLVITKVSE